jgi:hypothetical protein
MTEEAIKAWLAGRELTAEQNVMAVMVLNLARDYDEKRLTATSEACRRTFNDLRASLAPVVEEYDPLRDLLTR